MPLKGMTPHIRYYNVSTCYYNKNQGRGICNQLMWPWLQAQRSSSGHSLACLERRVGGLRHRRWQTNTRENRDGSIAGRREVDEAWGRRVWALIILTCTKYST